MLCRRLIMKELILDIRSRLNAIQEELAKMIGISCAAVNRWENGHSQPNKALQLRLYDICKERNVDPENVIRKKIEKTTANIGCSPERVLLYHGSRSGIKGPIAPISRERCDFGKGFYMGTEPCQPLTLISDFDESKFYVVSLNMTDLRILNLKPDLKWALLVAYNRSKMDEGRETSLYEHTAAMSKGYDVIVGRQRYIQSLYSFHPRNAINRSPPRSGWRPVSYLAAPYRLPQNRFTPW